jgi:hypothetical protein
MFPCPRTREYLDVNLLALAGQCGTTPEDLIMRVINLEYPEHDPPAKRALDLIMASIEEITDTLLQDLLAEVRTLG